MSMFNGKCEGCINRQQIIDDLRAELAESHKTLLALYNLPAYRARFPQPKAQPAPEEAQAPIVVTPEMLRGTTYTPPPGRDPFDVQRDFEDEH